MTQIIGFLGEKQSGKSTACNFVLGLKLQELGITKDFRINQDGQVEVTDILGQKPQRYKDGEPIGQKLEWFPFIEDFVNIESLNSDGLENYVKIYALADPLKRICVDILGLKEEMVYGSDHEKNKKCNIVWGSMPGVTFIKTPNVTVDSKEAESLNDYYKKIVENMMYHEPGRMKVREVLQHLGTEIFRKIEPNVWINTLMRRIEKDKPELALVCDVRFENEAKILKKKGYLVGLKRKYKGGKDSHASEQIDISLANKLVRNEDIDLPSFCKRIYKAVSSLPHIPKWEGFA